MPGKARGQKCAAGTVALLVTIAGALIHAQTPVASQLPQVPPPAQQPPAQQPPAGGPETIQMPPMPRVVLTAGRSTVLSTDFNITRIAITNPADCRCSRRHAARNPD